MSRYIGLDAHAKSCTLAVIGPSGRRLGSQVVETNGAALIAAIGAVARPRHLCLEEGTQSAWLYEILAPHVDEIVVTQSRGQPGQKSDKRDAFGLADGVRQRSFDRIVYKDPHRYGTLRALAHTYVKVRTDLVRTKNRIKSIYRGRGIATDGEQVYSSARREQWMKKLPAAQRVAVEFLYRELDSVRELKAELQKQLLRESHRHDISRVLETCPGLGEVRVALLIAAVVTPHRFRTSRCYWSYCGLGIVMRSSNDWQHAPDGRWVRTKVMQTRGLTHEYNRTLKDVYKGAAQTILRKPERPLRVHYDRLLEHGTRPPNAKLAIARQIASISLCMWKNQEVYDPSRYQPNR